MPFYEYECSNCKFYVEALQKISDEPLKKCPSCKKATLKKLVSAPVFRLKGGEIMGDMRPRSESRLAILPNTTHVTLMQRMTVIVPMVNDFFDAKPQKPTSEG